MTEGSAAAATEDEAETPAVVPSSMRFPVVGIGASAGGLEALTRFFENMPADNGMAFVVILHLSPKHKSIAAEILQKATRMPVMQVTGVTAIEVNHVYVIPPDRHLAMSDDHLEPVSSRRPRGGQIAIDLFFRALAEAHGPRAISIVLSGTGSDGTLGIARIKELGGVSFVQNPDDAGFDGMPKSAIASRLVDFVLPAAEMPQKLLALWDNARRIELPDAERIGMPAHLPDTEQAAHEAEAALRDVMVLLRTRTDHDFRHYKRATVLRRIERRLQVNGMPNLPAYRDYLHGEPGEAGQLLKDLLIGVTNFFRDREAFDAFERLVIMPLFEKRASEDPVRAWVPACATGEEAFSIAMLLSEQVSTLTRPPDVLVFATDIDTAAVATARAGLYPESIVADVAPTRLRQFFAKDQGRYRVAKSVRERVLFAVHNLLRDPPFSKLDLISCRNLLIYLDRQVQREVLQMFHFALRPGGHLFLGSSESADAAEALFSVVDKKHRIFRANEVARAGRTVPSMPLGAFEKHAPAKADAAPAASELPLAELHQRLLEQYAPPSVLLNREYTIVHSTAGAGRYLRHVGGTPSHNLLAQVLPALKLELRTALFQAAQTGNSVEARRVKLERDGRVAYVNMTARPVREANAGELFLVLFNDVEDTTANDGESASTDTKTRVVDQLEEELKRTKEQLQGVIEQTETSNEELKASNEELQAINEELRSATEELETSKEELQSVNEELITVNYELKTKVEETTRINDDLLNLVGSTDIATVFIDGAMQIKRYTPRALDLFNLIPTDVGRPLPDITHRLDYPDMTGDAAEVFRMLRPIEREVSAGNGRHYIARVLPYRTVQDRIEGAILTFIDVTSLRSAEDRLREGEEQMRLVAENARDFAIITTKVDGRISSWNVGAGNLFGYTANEILGEPLAMLFTPEDRARGVPEQEMATAAARQRSEDERWHLRKDGSRLYCSGITMLLKSGADEAPRGFAKIARDLTASRERAEERERMLASEQQSLAAARDANRAKDELLAVVSHELKHPLNLINVNAELIARSPDAQTPNLRRAVGAIRNAVAGQARVIDDLLDLSRLNTGKMTLDRVPVACSAVIGKIVDAFRDAAAGHQLIISFENRLEDRVMVLADPLRLEQIVWNLLSNAMKFTPAGGAVTVRAGTDGDNLRLEIIDSGQGIAPELLGHVFDMFRRGHGRPIHGDAGLGIGLALVDQLARLHDGRAMAASDGVGRGATFTVWLPLSTQAPPPSRPAVEESRQRLKGLHILLVDDTIDTLSAFDELLQLHESTVVAADSGAAALKVLAEQDFDLLLSDIGMPGMDGYELIRRVRSLSRNEGVAAVALSGYGRPRDVEQALAAGFDAHLAKPVSIDALIDTVHRLLKKPDRP